MNVQLKTFFLIDFKLKEVSIFNERFHNMISFNENFNGFLKNSFEDRNGQIKNCQIIT